MFRNWIAPKALAAFALLSSLLLSPLALAQPVEVEFCEKKFAVDVQEIVCEDAILTDLSPLTRFTKLKKLVLEVEIENPDFSVLATLQSLEELALYRVDLNDLSVLSSLRALQRLTLVQNTPFTDLSPLGALVSLQTLVLHNNEEVAPSLNLAPLRSLSALTTLSINVTTTEPMDIAALASLQKMTSLHLQGRFVSLVPIAKLNTLIKLSLFTEDLADIEGYAPLKALKTISVRSSRISIQELKAFTKLRPKVEVLGCKMILDPPCAVSRPEGATGTLSP